MKLFQVNMLVPDRYKGGMAKTNLVNLCHDEEEAKNNAINFLGIDNEDSWVSDVVITDVVEVMRDPNNKFGYIPVNKES